VTAVTTNGERSPQIFSAIGSIISPITNPDKSAGQAVW
jgi:hypothetical protein